MVTVLVRNHFCYNTYMINRVIGFFLFLTLTVFLLSQNSSGAQNINQLIVDIQSSLKQGDIPAYLLNFSPEFRPKEEERIRYLFDEFQMEDLTLFRAKRGTSDEEENTIYLQALFQNSYSVVIETWQLILQRVKDHWQIQEKSIVGDVRELYKIEIPSERVERVRGVEIEHVDIKLTFGVATLFYDNVPGLETALLIVGEGNLRFSPSDPKERHQLERLYKKKFLEDSLDYAYLRFSSFFFQSKIKIHPRTDDKRFQITSAERNKAASLFREHYPRSFTIENSLNGELLSFLPKGEETVFEFEGQRIGKFTYIHSPFAEEEVNLYQWKEDKIISLYSPLVTEKSRRLFFSFGQMFDIQSYHIDIAFDPKESYLSGKAKIEIQSRVESLDGVKLKFNPVLEILRIFDEEKRELFYTQDKLRKLLYVYFFQPPPKDRTSSIEIFYRGKLIPPKQTTDVVAGAQFNETVIYTPPKFESYLFSQSAYWHPAPPDDDYFQAHLKIIVPPDYTCISNGHMIEQYRLNGVERVEGIEKMDNSVFVFETEYPVKYISFLVGKFTKVDEDTSSLPLTFFKSATNLRFPQKQLLGEAKDIIHFYETLFGPYPYEKLAIVQRAWSTSGGHSPASFIVLNELPQIPGKGRLLNVQSPVDFSRWKEYFLAHEIAHQWWGQGVTWKTYHDQWLSEGLAQFSSILYLREKYGEKVLGPIIKKLSHWTEKKSEWGAITMGSRLSYFDYEAFQSIVYNKASLALLMLKDILGEEVFFRGLKKFFADHKYGPASTRDFIKTFSEVSEGNLELFFKGWFDSHTLPEVKVTHTLQKSGERYTLRFTVSQKNSLFVFPLWVEWTHNGKDVTKKLLIDEKKEIFDFELKERPRKIKINSLSIVPGRFD